MTVKTIENIAVYSCRKKPLTSKELKEIDERIADPYTLSGKVELPRHVDVEDS